MHELAAVTPDAPRTHLELVPDRANDRITLIRCPTCDGLRGCYARHEKRQPGQCKECRNGDVVLKEQFFGYWLERYTYAEIDEMAQAIFG